jgi:ElaB/YqjD/DUF883 family membrane-anchored ribosome-binding protein
MADSGWASAQEQALMKYLMEMDQWINNMEKLWGPEWAKQMRKQLEEGKRQAQQRIRGFAQTIEDKKREYERQAAAAGHQVTGWHWQ